MKSGTKRKKKKPISPKDLQKLWEDVDLAHVWTQLVQNVSKDVDAYEHARAKSREAAAHQVLL
ncbi:MAG: hypothetical protein HY896_12790 [Deltaproteobacteria bacterium]|nr:hypothetical protein [Deltaproteobacteria bacterium]